MANEILIIDDEKDIRALVGGILTDEGFATREAWSDETAFAEIEARVPSMVLLDIWLQGSRLDGLGILTRIKQTNSDLPVVMISGHGNIETAVNAIRLGAYDFIEKPFEADRLLISVRRALENLRLQRENAELREQVGGETELIGESGAMQSVRQSIERVAPTGSRVMIFGPAGSGKEVVARLIHDNSRLSTGPFVVLNAAALAPERMEEELFGIESRGEGANGERKLGTFERAHGGTLFIDEVADMPLETQGKILRVLHDQSFVRVGGSMPVQVDVRVFSATSRDLAEEISAGRFREDLYYRLNVVPIRIPSLSERREDIPRLADYFMERAAKLTGLPQRELAEDALAVMQTCDWPGNARQLKNVIDWILIMSPPGMEGPVRAGMLPPDLVDPGLASMRVEKSGEFMAMPLREAREVFERQYLQAQVTRFGHNISRTATFVGMERSALHRKLKALGITNDDR